jgi:hypothetical protein
MTGLNRSGMDGTVVCDFAQRTLVNLKFIEKHYTKFRKGEEEIEVYEITQLINSMLGLLVFPKETFWDHLKPIALSEIPKKVNPFNDEDNSIDLRQLIRLIRNSFAHFNLDIKAGANYIYAIEMHNRSRNGKINWQCTVSVFKLRKFIEWFIKGIIDSSLLDIPVDQIKVEEIVVERK